MLSWQSTKTNKAASDATIEAHVVMSFACVEWCGVAHWSPTGHLFRPFRWHQSNHCLWDNYHRSVLFVERITLAYYARSWKCCCALCLCMASSVHMILARYHTISGCHDNRRVADSAIDIMISPNWYEP